MNQEESEHNEVDGMKKGVDSTGEVMYMCFVTITEYHNGLYKQCEVFPCYTFNWNAIARVISGISYTCRL